MPNNSIFSYQIPSLDEILRKKASIKPVMNNFFWVVLFGRDESMNLNDPADSYDMANNIAPFLCQKITLPAGYNFTYFEDTPYYEKFIKEAKFSTNQITFSWLEDSQFHVWEYHNEWMRNYFNPETQRFVVGPKGKIRYAIVDILNTDLIYDKEAISAVTNKGENMLIYATVPVHRFIIKGLQPINSPSNLFTFDVTKTQETGVVDYNYYFSNIEYIYLDPYGEKEKDLVKGRMRKLTKNKLRIL